MLIDPFTDGHVHTVYCHHAVGDMEDYVVAAIGKGLTKIVFLEHMEEGIDSSRVTWLTEDDFELYFAEGLRLKSKYADQLSIGLGVEVGFNPAQIDALLDRLSRRKWDSIGISMHFFKIDDSEAHINLVSKREPRLTSLSLKEAEAIEREYYRYLLQAVELLPGTVLCHIDGVFRHYLLRQKLEQPWELIDTLLEKVADKKIALEVNTSGLAIRNEIFPCERILRKALSLQISLVAGSDAHRPEDIGNGFENLNDYLEGLQIK